MLELANHKKTAAVIAVVLCIPMVLIVLLSLQLASRGLSFEHVTEATLELQDGSRLTLTAEADLNLFMGMLERASEIDEPVRDTQGETPLLLTLGDAVYRLYPSLSLSGCMAFDEEGACYLITAEDAAALVVREELEYLYADHHLPSLAVRSGEKRYDILPTDYVWSYKKANGVYYNDLSAQTSQEVVTCNLFADFENLLEFSVEPSHYSFVVRRYENGADGYEVPVTSLGGLHFTGDTLISVEITATWSQASNAAQYGEASYRFLALYDVPAVVKLHGVSENSVTLSAGGYLALVAEFTNPNEDLSITFREQTSTVKFHYDEGSGNSYAFLPIDPETPAGVYPLTVRSGDTEYGYSVTVEARENDEIISVAVSDSDYAKYYAPEVLEGLEKTLADLQNASLNTPLLRTDLIFGQPISGDPAYTYGATVIVGNAGAANDPGVSYLMGNLYKGDKNTEVEAVQNGVCVFAGELGALGNVVVVDHGCGVFSYYALLDTLIAKAGDQISRSEELGTLGASSEQGNLFFALSMNGVFVAP